MRSCGISQSLADGFGGLIAVILLMQTALIVDDEPFIRDWVAHFVQERGYQTHLAASVGEALEQLRANSFDLVVTDFNMPDGTGGTVLQTARVRFPSVPRILMTGVLAAVPEEDLALADHSIEKPNVAAPLHAFLEKLQRRTVVPAPTGCSA